MYFYINAFLPKLRQIETKKEYSAHNAIQFAKQTNHNYKGQTKLTCNTNPKYQSTRQSHSVQETAQAKQINSKHLGGSFQMLHETVR